MIGSPKLLWIIVVLFPFTLSTNGQKAPVKFGKIDIADLEMTVYPLDSTAEAVILCDYGNFNPNENKFTRILRVKILKKEGTRHANLIIPGSEKSLIRGRTYNLVDGEIVTEKLKNESIFKEKITDYTYELRVGMPNVRVGTIFEISYSRSYIPREWRFQDEIPVRWSELRLPEHTYYSLQKNFMGYEPLKEASDSRWVAENMPAFQSEPYVNSPSNYIRKVELEISSINIPGGGGVFMDFTSSWHAVNKYFYESLSFGEMTRGAFLHFANEAKEIEESCTTDREKIIAAHKTIRDVVQWNKRNRLFPYSNLNFIYNNKKIGSSADINFLLLQLLKKLDLEVYPMITSTRGNGMVYEYFPTVEGFNYVIVYVKSGDDSYFLDATDRFCPAGMLPQKCLNGKGFLIMRDKGQWIEIPLKKPSTKMVYCDMALDENGSLKGSLSYQRTDYSAAWFRKRFDGFNSTEEYLDDFEKNNSDCVVSDFSIEDLEDLDKPVIANYQLEMMNKAMVMGDEIFLEPILFEKISENPFRIEERDYPIDFNYPRSTVYIAKFIVPEGYIIEEMPEACRMILKNNSATFTYSITPRENTIQVMYNFVLSKPVYFQMEYKELKELYNHIVSKLAEPIILKKIENES